MPTRTDRPLSQEAEVLAERLVSALRGGDSAAGSLADALVERGVHSLKRLVPRGSLSSPAGDEWNRSCTLKLIGQIAAAKTSEPIVARTLNALGYFAGGDAVPDIRRLMMSRMRKRQPSSAEQDTVLNGLYALHLIGGPEAVKTLSEFQGTKYPERIRERAHWYLNELGGRIVDLMFGSDDLSETMTESNTRLPDDSAHP